jgi:uncharacterized protein YkwD
VWAARRLGAALAAAAVCALLLPAAARPAVRALPSLQAQVVARINVVRAEHGLPALRRSAGLSRAAAAHARAMGVRGFFGHASPAGESMEARLGRHYGSPRDRYWAVGENLLWNVRVLDARTIVRLWLGSPKHRRVLLWPRFRELGVSVVRATRAPGRTFLRRDVTIVTADFGVRLP